MLLHLAAQEFDGLFRGFKRRLLDDFEQAFVRELFLLAVLGFVQSVGIDKQGLSADIGNFLSYIVQLRPETDRRIRLHFDEFGLFNVMSVTQRQEDGRIVTGIAEVKMSRREIHHA